MFSFSFRLRIFDESRKYSFRSGEINSFERNCHRFSFYFENIFVRFPMKNAAKEYYCGNVRDISKRIFVFLIPLREKRSSTCGVIAFIKILLGWKDLLIKSNSRENIFVFHILSVSRSWIFVHAPCSTSNTLFCHSNVQIFFSALENNVIDYGTPFFEEGAKEARKISYALMYVAWNNRRIDQLWCQEHIATTLN